MMIAVCALYYAYKTAENAKAMADKCAQDAEYFNPVNSFWIDMKTTKQLQQHILQLEEGTSSAEEKKILEQIHLKMRAVEGMTPQIKDINRRVQILLNIKPIMNRLVQEIEQLSDADLTHANSVLADFEAIIGEYMPREEWLVASDYSEVESITDTVLNSVIDIRGMG